MYDTCSPTYHVQRGLFLHTLADKLVHCIRGEFPLAAFAGPLASTVLIVPIRPISSIMTRKSFEFILEKDDRDLENLKSSEENERFTS